MDDESLSLIIALQQEDVVDHLAAGRQQDLPNGEETNFAFELYGEELEIQQRILDDKRMAGNANQLEISRETQTNKDVQTAEILNALTNVSSEERSRILAEALRSKVALYQPEVVTEITDRLLEIMSREMSHLEILNLFNDDETLHAKINEVQHLCDEEQGRTGQSSAEEDQEDGTRSSNEVKYGAEKAGLSDATTATERKEMALERNSEVSANPRKRPREEDTDGEGDDEDVQDDRGAGPDEQGGEQQQDDDESDEDGIAIAGLGNGFARTVHQRKHRKFIPKPRLPFRKQKIYERKNSNKARKTFPESSATTQLVNGRCSICLDEFSVDEMAQLSCEHNICTVCVTTTFEMAAMCEGSYPPKCCSKIDLEEVESLLDQGLVLRFKAKKTEWDTKPDQRLYCFEPGCSAFILPSAVDASSGKCPSCGSLTCVKCKKSMHDGDCNDRDEGEQEMRKLAADEGWQDCGECGAVVELTTGCNHMKCYCRNEFCYACGKTWKECECPWWDEDRLTERAQRPPGRNHINQYRRGEGLEPIVDPNERIDYLYETMGVYRQPGFHAQGCTALGRIERAREHFGRHYDCTHGGLRRIEIPGRCMECRDDLLEYLMRCPSCGLAICLWCSERRVRHR